MFRNCLRRAYEDEMVGFRNTDIHSYAKKCDQIRMDFKKLRAAEDIKEVDSVLEKYEFYIENSYKINVYTRKKFFEF